MHHISSDLLPTVFAFGGEVDVQIFQWRHRTKRTRQFPRFKTDTRSAAGTEAIGRQEEAGEAGPDVAIHVRERRSPLAVRSQLLLDATQDLVVVKEQHAVTVSCKPGSRKQRIVMLKTAFPAPMRRHHAIDQLTHRVLVSKQLAKVRTEARACPSTQTVHHDKATEIRASFDLASDDFNALLQNRIFTTVPRAIVAKGPIVASPSFTRNDILTTYNIVLELLLQLTNDLGFTVHVNTSQLSIAMFENEAIKRTGVIT